MQILWQVEHFGYGGDLRRANFVTGAAKRDFWTCGSLSEIGGSLARKLRFGILMLSLEALLRRNALSGLRHVNLEMQIDGRHSTLST